MKRILFILSMLIGVAYGQVTGHFRFDSTMLYKNGGNNELILLNGSRAITGGVLTNIGNGRTAFVTPSGSTNTSIGSGFDFGWTGTNNIRRFLPYNGLTGDTSGAANTVRIGLGGPLTKRDTIITYPSKNFVIGDTSIGAYTTFNSGGYFTVDMTESGNSSGPGMLYLQAENFHQIGLKFRGKDPGFVRNQVDNTNTPASSAEAGIAYENTASGFSTWNTYSDRIGQFFLGAEGNNFADSSLMIRTNAAGIQFAADNNGYFLFKGSASNLTSVYGGFYAGGRFGVGTGTTTPGQKVGIVGSLSVSDSVLTPGYVRLTDTTGFDVDMIDRATGNHKKMYAGLLGGGATPTWQQTLDAGSTTDKDNTIVNGANTLTITNNTLANSQGVILSSSSTAAIANQTMLLSQLSGTNANSGVESFGVRGIVARDGTGSINTGIFASASQGAASNTGVYGQATDGVTAIGGLFQASGAINNFAVQLVDGTEGVGKVLTSDATGKASWATPSAGSGTVNTGTQYRIAYYATTGTAVSEAAAITAARALISDANGVPTHSTTTATQLAYLNAATGTTGTASTNIVFSTTPSFTGPVLINQSASTNAVFKLEVGDGATDTRTYLRNNGALALALGGASGSLNYIGSAASDIQFLSGGAGQLARITNAGSLIVGSATTATARLLLPAGATAASTAPLKFTTGSLQTTAEAGAVEYNTPNLYFTAGDAVRYTLAKTLTATATLNFDLTAVNSQDLTITVTGAASGDAVSLALDPASVAADVTFFGWVSAANTVTVRCSRVGGGGAADPASGTFRASVIKY